MSFNPLTGFLNLFKQQQGEVNVNCAWPQTYQVRPVRTEGIQGLQLPLP